MADLHPSQEWQFYTSTVNVADQVADLPPVLAASGQEWQFYISTVRVNVDRSSGRSTPPSPPIEHRPLEHHYTEEVSHTQECTYTHARHTPN